MYSKLIEVNFRISVGSFSIGLYFYCRRSFLLKIETIFCNTLFWKKWSFEFENDSVNCILSQCHHHDRHTQLTRNTILWFGNVFRWSRKNTNTVLQKKENQLNLRLRFLKIRKPSAPPHQWRGSWVLACSVKAGLSEPTESSDPRIRKMFFLFSYLK